MHCYMVCWKLGYSGNLEGALQFQCKHFDLQFDLTGFIAEVKVVLGFYGEE